MPNKPLSKAEKERMANSLGTGGANRAAKAIMNRQDQIDAVSAESAPAPKASPKVKMKDASAGAMRDYQMEQAIEMVRKAKTARRTAY